MDGSASHPAIIRRTARRSVPAGEPAAIRKPQFPRRLAIHPLEILLFPHFHVNRHFLTFIFALCAVSLLGGFGARRLASYRPASQATGSAAGASVKTAREAAPLQAAPTFPPPRSADTLETLAALDDAHLYARLALWLVDASEPDIAAFWSGYSKKADRSTEITGLVFLHWTRLDPQRAISGAVETGIEPDAWWAWACHDPKASLAAALANDPESVESVALGLAKFHPDWLRNHLEEIPENLRDSAIRALGQSGGGDPLETLRFLRKQGGDAHPDLLKAFAREDPWAAVEWAMQKPGSGDPFRSDDDDLQTILRTLAEESPDELARIAERTPSGKAKLEMESALFTNLLKTDPAAALEQARSATVPRTAAERYAAIGQVLVHSDPAQALQLAKDLFAACPGALELTAQIVYPEGNSNTQTLDIPGVSEFMKSLMGRQPQQVMEMIAALPQTPQEDPFADDPFHRFSRQWIEQDLVGYTNWLNQQTDTLTRQSGAIFLVSELRQSNHFQEAAEWASSVDTDDTALLDDVILTWQAKEAEAPALWLKDANLPAARKAAIQSLLDRPR